MKREWHKEKTGRPVRSRHMYDKYIYNEIPTTVISSVKKRKERKKEKKRLHPKKVYWES